ncbi:flagellar type III secretion system pore protein FliP [Acutalibacter sp. 1XD8-33]|uniref:flagellar type III secretion system pore protein FliP n=1 Tax=Acutalibacter sp. 1XD8-33 TaxID=2320081 RepID=UPI001FAA1AE9|nr:flagellar type III secretion system pore protein FliP [Acutalibacter sp. 1XD8-33]
MPDTIDGIININGDSVQALEIIILTTLITLLPSLVIMCSSFTRYVITLSFLRNAMGTQQTPPNMVLVGIALFLTLFTMGPVIDQVNEVAYTPYINEEITQDEFFDLAQVPLKEFMLRNTEPSALNMFCDLAGVDNPSTEEEGVELPLRIVTPAFITTELKHAFEIGFYLYIPFLLIDIVVASTLMSMGMVMLPPSMISTPFKLLLFVSINGWEMVFSTLVQTFH